MTDSDLKESARHARRRLIPILAVVLASCIAYMFFGQAFLTAECKVERAEIGIAGITKTYSVMLLNRSPLPVRFAGCSVTTDAGEQGIELVTSIEKWNRASDRWVEFWRVPPDDYCNREPDVLSARRQDYWLWPGKRILTGDIAIQATDGLQMGDLLRWKVFPRGSVVIASVPFSIDERPKKVPAQGSPQLRKRAFSARIILG